MIESLDIRKYQSHEHSHFDFAPGVNVLVGASDAGKSAALRALLWVAMNRPSGDEFRSWTGGDTVVKIETSDEAAITRTKAGKRNDYVLDTPIGTLDFKAIGAGEPPAEITAALNLAAVNVQRQLDSPFLLSSDWSPGRVAEYLNEAAGLDAIDRATAHSEAEIRRIKSDVDKIVADIAVAEVKHEALDYVDAMADKMARLEVASAKAGRVRSAEQELNAVVVAIASIRDALERLPDHSLAAVRLDSLMSDNKRADALDASYNQIKTIVDEITSLNKKIAETTKTVAADEAVGMWLSLLDDDNVRRKNADELRAAVNEIKATTEKIDACKNTTRAERLCARTLGKLEDTRKLNESCANIESILGDVLSGEEMLGLNAEDLVGLEERWHEIAPDACPLCAGTGRLK